MQSTDPIQSASASPKKRGYVPAIGPGLKKLLTVLFIITSLLGANSLYLGTITFLEWQRGQGYQNQFYMFMFLGHLVLGFVLLLPFLVFGTVHLVTARKRKNKRAIRVGYMLFTVCLVVLISGLMLVRIRGVLELKNPSARALIYWMHVIAPFVGIWLYWLHRLVGQKIRWKLGAVYGVIAVASVAAMVSLHMQDPREWSKKASAEGEKYFEPSLARTSNGGFIPADNLDNDEYCLSCHEDSYRQWEHSAHRFSSFNNPAYLVSIRETRDALMKRDGSVKGSRWCAGCHDPVPFLSGAFDNPQYDDVNHPTSQSGITCTTCHAITGINSTRGNADYTIEEPLHYPFAFSQNPVLLWINHQLIKAKPAFHQKTFLKPVHRTSEFCSACHKVHLPYDVTHYKEFLRGQNHYDSWLGSGVSGHGARSFYYPEVAKTSCANCHMDLVESQDFGARVFDTTSGKLSIHDHSFASGNTGLPFLRGYYDKVEDKHKKFLDKVIRVDIFGIKEEGKIDGKLHAPLRPEIPTLRRGQEYLLESVIRTLKVGHEFTQGTVDSNEVWVEVTLESDGRTIAQNGALDEKGEVDRNAHFINVFMLDRHGQRINRRNAQDIFTPLYNHQIPPGSGQVAHYQFKVPEDIQAPIKATVKVQYRKFDQEYMEITHKQLLQQQDPSIATKNVGANISNSGLQADGTYVNNLPIITLASDSVVFPVEGLDGVADKQTSEIPVWQRWNDYGIGLFLEGKAELKQAEQAFQQVEQLKRYDGPINLARLYLREGRIDEAGAAVQRAAKSSEPAAPEWSVAWFAGLVNREQGRLVEAEENFRAIVDKTSEERIKRKFDFSKDTEVLNTLGRTLLDRAEQMRQASRSKDRKQLLEEAAKQFQRTLAIDSENVNAHYNLGLVYAALGDTKNEKYHKQLHLRYKPDDNAQGVAVGIARQKYPSANLAAESLVIYPLTAPTSAKTENVTSGR
jgi:tetratricopeptide (TPR) repeat protein